MAVGATRSEVIAVAGDAAHRFSKPVVDSITLTVGIGVDGDCHAGDRVQHLSRVAKDPSKANLRQVHLIQAELFDELAGKGFVLTPGAIGENVTTRGIDLLGLATGTVLRLGTSAAVTVTGLRTPCIQLDRFQKGLMHACLDQAADGRLIRKAGIMGTVVAAGTVRAGDPITLVPPEGDAAPLEPV